MRTKFTLSLTAGLLAFALLTCEARAGGAVLLPGPRDMQQEKERPHRERTRYSLESDFLFSTAEPLPGDGEPIFFNLLQGPYEESGPPGGPPPGQYRRGGPPPHARARGRRGQARKVQKPDRSVRIGWLFIADAVDEIPADVPTFGFSARFHPLEGDNRFEISFETSIEHMDIDPTPLIMEEFYGEYLELVFAFLGRFRPPPGQKESPLYWGVGLGYSKETYRVNYEETARATWSYPGAASDYDEGAVFQLKLGLETERNGYVELIYKKRFGDSRNLDQMFNLVFGFYF